ncbi:bifunctional tetrahydrofolate synthase/dihydrofolate synthase [Nitrincola sp.]|uniref:bifunctional tetrahydrofolate synthase/dihydrofolate synthase n=1 Tax=Nitrincola sp. TaxID=1926584 RepID=UPI003A92DCD2
MSQKQPTTDASLDQWLSYIEACHPAEIELGLERMRQVAGRLPLDLSGSFKVVVAGTNGKGTSIRMLESILQQAGLRVGTYTSPHFLRYNERITLFGQAVDDALICAAFSQVEAARQGVPLTYFEYGTLAALIIFSDAVPDVLLLEIGLGGRLDSVNLVDADVALVTTIALDHTDWLGPDRESIGFEKAGIFRAGGLAVCGDPQPPASLLKHAAKLAVDLRTNGQAYQYSLEANDLWTWQGQDLAGSTQVLSSLPRPSLPIQNAAAVLQVLQLMPFTIEKQSLSAGLVNARLTGRMQPASLAGYPCILDVAHNPEAAVYLATRLSQPAVTPTHLLLGMLADKDMASVCEALLPVVDHWHLVTLSNPRGASAAQLKQLLNKLGVPSSSMAEYDSVDTALAALPSQLTPTSRLVIAGSFFTVTDALKTVEWVDGRQG